MLFQGLSEEKVLKSREDNGSNALTQVKQDTLLDMFLEGFKDPIIMILLVALVIQVIFVVLGRAHWYEAAGIFAALLIANFVGAWSGYKQQGEANTLKAEELTKERVKVVRAGVLKEIGINDVVVGDVVVLEAGNKIPADGILLDGVLKVDQAALNGESKEATKEAQGVNDLGDIKDLLNPYYIYRGTVVTSGLAHMEVQQVGDKTIYGELALEMQEETRDTPLKVKLSKLAEQISLFGYIGAGVIAGAYILNALVLSGNPIPDALGVFQVIIEAISLAVVIIVMAVPEGLPMMINLVLSMNMRKMMKDNVLVQKMQGIETAGGLNILFTDKTGTLTEGKLVVVDIVDGSGQEITGESTDEMLIMNEHNPCESYVNEFLMGTVVNNSANLSGATIIGGNSTDRALIGYYQDMEDKTLPTHTVLEVVPFNSADKYSTVKVEIDNKVKVYIKGAPEKVLAKCTKYLSLDGEVKDFKASMLEAYMTEQANRSMRLLAVAYGETDEELTLVSILSIRDDVRKEVPNAIEDVNKAGVQVVMVTGDRRETAIAIGKEAGLIKSERDIVLTSTELNSMSDEDIKKVLPNLKVVARALPTDKSRLVKVAQELNLVVGMTGDGRLCPVL